MKAVELVLQAEELVLPDYCIALANVFEEATKYFHTQRNSREVESAAMYTHVLV